LANPLVEFNDSQLGVVLGSVLHTLGAIAFLGGLVGYLSWHRHLAAKGHHHGRLLDNAAFLTYLSIVVNLLGGFMRTFQTGHPHLTQWSESPWVRAIAIKHVFLFVAQGAAIYLFEVIAPRLVKAHKAEALSQPSPLGHRLGVLLVALGILVASVLGALTQVVPLISADAGMEEHEHQTLVEHANATGQLTSSPVQPGRSTGPFRVPNGTVLLEATLTWAPTQYALRLDLAGPGVTVDSAQGVAGPAGTLTVELEAPPAGDWTYAIESDLAVDASWTLSIRMVVEVEAQASSDAALASGAPE
jgi:hypothetical protein